MWTFRIFVESLNWQGCFSRQLKNVSVLHAPARLMCLTRFLALRASVPYASSRFTCPTHAPYLRTLCALFVRVKVFLRWIYRLAKIFRGLLKGLQIVLFLRENFLSIFNMWNEFNVFVFFFSSLQAWRNKFFE